MDGDSDISMVDAPESSPRPAGAYLSGPPTNYSTSIFASHAEKYRRNNQPASRSLLRPSMLSNTIKPIRRALPYSPPMQLAKSRISTISVPKSGPNYFNTPKSGLGSFKNLRIRSDPYYVPSKSAPRRLSPSEYRRLASRQKNPTPNPLKMTWNPVNDLRVVNSQARLERARIALEAAPGGILNLPPGKRPVSDAEDSEPKRARMAGTQGAAMSSTPVQSPVRRMPGSFPESPAHVETAVENQPAAQTVATPNNIALAGLSIYARIRRITGVVRGAHRALKQGIRASTQFAAAVGQRIRVTHAPIPTVVVEERRETQETYEGATSVASAQLQAELTAHVQASPPRYAIQIVDPSAQLHAELVDHASHISPPSTIVAAPQAPSTISANLIAQDQPSVREETMSEPSATLPEVQPTASIQAQATPDSFEVPVYPDTDIDQDPDVLKVRASFDRMRGGRPRPEPSPYREAFFRRLMDRPRARPRAPPRARPVTPSDTSLDAEVSSELAQEREEQSQETSSTPEQDHPTVDEQDITQIEEQQAEEQAEEQATEDQAYFDCPNPPDNDEEYDPNAYYPGVPPLMPERRFIFNAEFRRKAAEQDKVERKAAAAREAVEGPVREYLAAVEALEAAKAKQARDALRPILRRRRGDNPNQRQIEAAIQETVNQLAATTVHDGVPEVPEVPETPHPPHNKLWPNGGINFGVDSPCRFYDPRAPPIEQWKGPEPKDRAGVMAYEAKLRRDEEEWEREQQQEVLQQRERALGRVGVPTGYSAVRSLTPAWERRLTSAMRSEQDIVLAKTSEADLTKEKLKSCWIPLAWLNDEVINGHLKHTVNYLRRQANNLGPTDAPKYYAFNSFFYKKLRESGYQGVARWAKRGKIGGSALLNVETVFIPVHEGAHWTLLVVSPKNRTIEYFDSLGGNADSFVANTRVWLKGELGDAYNESEWLFLNTESPQQDNGSDCGVFLLTSAKAIALGLEPKIYGPKDIGLIRRKIVAELMNGGLEGDFDPRGTSGVKRL